MSAVPLFKFFAKSFVMVFNIVDPIGVLPIFLALTEGYPDEKVKDTIHTTAFTTFFVLFFFALFGEGILNFFGIKFSTFKIAGGIIIFYVGMEMLNASVTRLKSTPEEHRESLERDDIAVVPLAIPLLSGPGAITTVVTLCAVSNGILEKLAIFFAIFLTSFFTYIILKTAKFIKELLGQTGINILVRIMGLIVCAISVQFVIDGIREIFVLN